MLFSKPSQHKRGDIVKLANEPQEMEVTYVRTFWFSHDTVSVIYIKSDGEMQAYSGFHPDSLHKVIK
jgi:hypothetical protein